MERGPQTGQRKPLISHGRIYGSYHQSRYSEQKNARSDYVEIAKDPTRWRDFIKGLVYSQATYINCAVTALVRMNVYNEMNGFIELREPIPPFALGARYCVTECDGGKNV